MDLNLSSELAARLAIMIKKDRKLSRSLAGQLLTAVDKQAMAGYLFSKDVALELLTRRLRADPERTVQDLTALMRGEAVRQKRGRGGAKPARRGVATVAGRRTTKARRRQRLSAENAEQLRSKVRAYLEKKPWSGRKELTAAVEFPSQAIYNRIMGELKKAGVVKQKGEKSKATYAVKA